MSKKEEMYARIRQHGENLKAVFGLADVDPVALCKKLRMLENKAHHSATLWCNGDISEDDFKKESLLIVAKVLKVLGDRYPVFVNSDPRGYALKIDDKIVLQHNLCIYKDWGGYGIIAPDLTEG
jgi:hypothetical protein